MERHREEMLEKTQGKSSGEKTPRKVKDFEAEGREERERPRGGETRKVWENRREGGRWEMSQGPLAGRAGRGGEGLGRRPVTCGPSPHCWVRRSRKRAKGIPGQSGAVGRARVL